jgi:hypothetical protein
MPAPSPRPSTTPTAAPPPRHAGAAETARGRRARPTGGSRHAVIDKEEDVDTGRPERAGKDVCKLSRDLALRHSSCKPDSQILPQAHRTPGPATTNLSKNTLPPGSEQRHCRETTGVVQMLWAAMTLLRPALFAA